MKNYDSKSNTHELHGMRSVTTVQANHTFFWDTRLTPERMGEISDWIGTLSGEQRKLLSDLLGDVRDDTWWDAQGEE